VKNVLPFFFLVFSLPVFGQTSIADLDPQHREVLENYLRTRASMALRSETIVDREYLVSMVEGMVLDLSQIMSRV
jgi:hypothetical protein